MGSVQAIRPWPTGPLGRAVLLTVTPWFRLMVVLGFPLQGAHWAAQPSPDPQAESPDPEGREAEALGQVHGRAGLIRASAGFQSRSNFALSSCCERSLFRTRCASSEMHLEGRAPVLARRCGSGLGACRPLQGPYPVWRSAQGKKGKARLTLLLCSRGPALLLSLGQKGLTLRPGPPLKGDGVRAPARTCPLTHPA